MCTIGCSRGSSDVVIGQTFSGPELVDSTVDFRPLVEAAEGTNCRVHAAIQSHVDSDRLGEASIEMVRATACNYWAQGVDGLYLAHWFGNWPYQADFYEKLRELPHPEVMASQGQILLRSHGNGTLSKTPYGARYSDVAAGCIGGRPSH